MKSVVKKLCELLQDRMDVPVFDYQHPEGYLNACVVVNETSFSEETEEGEYTIDIYAPDTERTLNGVTDNSYPDIETIEKLGDNALSVCKGMWENEFNGWTHKRQLLSQGNMHYLNICLTIQFN